MRQNARGGMARSGHSSRRARRWIIAVSIGLLALFFLDLAYVAIRLQTRLTVATAHLDAMRNDLESGSLSSARGELDAARAAASSAGGLLGHPAVRTLGVLPVVGGEADTLRRVVRAAELVTDAGEPGLRAASILDYRGGTIGRSVYDDGRINLEVLSKATPFVARVQEFLDEAARTLESGDRAFLPQLRSAVDRARREIGDAASIASGAGTLLRLLPRLTGGEGNRKYLLAFQALGEARATGGVAGLYGVLHARDGEVRLGRIAPYITITEPKASPQTVPSWFARTYGIQGALKEWPQANLSPNFPVGARVMLEMYRRSFGQSLDGVIAVDAVALSLLMKGTGSFDIEGFDEPITADNVVRVLSEDAYLDFPSKKEQNLFLAELVRQFWSRIEEGDLEVEPFARGLGRAVATQHLKVFSAHGPDRTDLEEFDADGSLERFGANLQAVFHNNYGVNKVDYYLHRSVDTRIEIGAGGDLRVTTTVGLRNDAPDGPRSDLLGRKKTGLPAGANRMTLNFLLPIGAKAGRLEVDGKRARTSIPYRDSKHPLVWDVLTIQPGEEATARLEYVVPEGASLGEDDVSLSYWLLPQPVLNPDALRVTVKTPPGFTLVGSEANDRGDFVVRHEDETPLRLSVEYQRS